MDETDDGRPREAPAVEQIYYTQCPIGYGLGASNGFQIKRLSEGYPASGDFRFLGMRAFLPGSRLLSPPALRYRRDGEIAEIAWLTPRPQEYQTERGLWGRPGGHFAHGVRLDPVELAALASWPAGLFDRPGWRRSDPEPTRGRPPEPVVLDPEAPPTFAAVAPMARGADSILLARLLAALAVAAREGRTLYLIDEQARLAPRVALLTFAFPESMRPALTFSTYHDRPEELPGFRLQGTSPAARPNRPALAASGIVADLLAGTFEPAVVPAAWARTLADWFTRAGASDERAWVATNARAARVRALAPPESAWSDAWLDHLFDFHDAVEPPARSPADREGWVRLADTARWAARAGLGDEWAQARGASWWASTAGAARVAEARRALVAHGRLVEAWSGVDGSTWGEVAARWLAPADESERIATISTLLRSAPPARRPAFLAAALRGLPPSTLDGLKAGGTMDPAMLLPLDVRAAVPPALDRGAGAPLRAALAHALALPAVLGDALDALAAEVAGRPGAMGSLAPILADHFEQAEDLGRDGPRTWALARTDPTPWIGPYLRRLFGPPHGSDAWRALRDRTPASQRPALARAVLGVASDPTLADAPFRWGVEELLLALPEPDRPHDPGWPDTYLVRTPSGLDLVARLFAREPRSAELRRWIKAARDHGELSATQAGRIEQAQAYARALATGDARSLIGVDLPVVPPAERGALLGQILGHVGGAAFERLDLCLESCRMAWPGAFDPGAPGLSGLARPLAQALLAYQADPALWLDRLGRVLSLLGVAGPDQAFTPDSLAAEVLAATSARTGPDADPWRLRQALLHRDDAWRILAVDARRDGLEGRRAPETLERWDRRLDKPGSVAIARFFELILNACDGPALAACVAARAADLRNLGPLPWWPSSRTPGAVNDLRDGFARLAPMDPLVDEALHPVRLWMRSTRRHAPTPLVHLDGDGPDLVPLDSARPAPHAEPDGAHLSDLGRDRWLCLEGLSSFARPGLDSSRWPVVLGWITDRLPLDRLTPDDRHRFLAHVLARTEALDSVQVARLARWLARCGFADADRLAFWADELASVLDVSNSVRVARMTLVSDLRVELKTLLRELRDG